MPWPNVTNSDSSAEISNSDSESAGSDTDSDNGNMSSEDRLSALVSDCTIRDDRGLVHGPQPTQTITSSTIESKQDKLAVGSWHIPGHAPHRSDLTRTTRGGVGVLVSITHDMLNKGANSAHEIQSPQ